MPRLSVVLATDDFATIQDLVDALAAQTVAAEVEIVVVCPSADDLGAPDEPGPWDAFCVVEHALLPLGEARAAGIRAAGANVVVIAETHAIPAPDWAENLVRAHDERWVAVMPAVANANPASALSWAALLVDYGDWTLDRGPREIDNPPRTTRRSSELRSSPSGRASVSSSSPAARSQTSSEGRVTAPGTSRPRESTT